MCRVQTYFLQQVKITSGRLFSDYLVDGQVDKVARMK